MNPLGLLTALPPDGPSKDTDEAWQDHGNPQRFNLSRNNFGEAFFILQEDRSIYSGHPSNSQSQMHFPNFRT